MQQWVNDPKNRPIVYGLAGVLTVAAIVFILFQVGVFGSSDQPFVPPSSPAPVPGTAANTAAVPSGAAPPGATPPGVTPGPSAGPPFGAAPSAATAPVVPTVTASASPTAGIAARPPVAAVTSLAAPGARKDPFAPYIDITKFLQELLTPKENRPPVETFAPNLSITTYVPPAKADSSIREATQATAVASVGRVSGVMLGTGAYAIIDNNGQSLVLQPGDKLPDGSELTNIQSDSVTIKTNGQYVKVPITSGDESTQPTPGGPTGPQGGGYPPTGVPTGPGGPPPGFGGPPPGAFPPGVTR